MRAREQALRAAGIDVSLVYPVVLTQAVGGRLHVRGNEFTVRPYADITHQKSNKVRVHGPRVTHAFRLFAEQVANDLAALRLRIPPLTEPIPIVDPPPYIAPTIHLPDRT